MKKAIGSISLLFLILVATLSASSFGRSTLARSVGNDTPYDALASEGTKTVETGSSWDFSRPNDWSNFTFLDNNRTRLIVGIDPEKRERLIQIENIVAKDRATIVDKVLMRSEVRAVVVEISLSQVTSFVEEVRNAGLATYVEPNMKVEAQFIPDDPYWSLQWGPQRIGADWAWNITTGNPSVLVAVVDTGIYYSHPDLAVNYVPLGYDWVHMDPDPLDDHGHGTHCAGIIAGVLNNGIGIAGLAQVRVMAEKVLDSGGYGYWDWVANGIIHAAESGAKIISMSLGGSGDSELVHEAVKYAYDSGVLIIAAAGNSNSNMKSYPAGYDEVVAVAATDQYDSKAWFSNWGEWIELAAPGVDIYSTVPWGYESWSGTSMACPHVSGLAALILSRYPERSKDWVRLWLRYTANDLGNPGVDVYYGYGRINARKAVEQTPPAHELVAYEWQIPPYVKPGTTAIINATVLNFGDNDETDVTVQLLTNGSIADSAMIGSLRSGSSSEVSFIWDPSDEGSYNVTVYVVPVAGEENVGDNLLWKNVLVGFPVKAVVLHSAGNVYGEIIVNWQALNDEWYVFGGTMVYIDYTILNKQDITYEDIVASEADVLIISCASDQYAGWEFTDSEIDAIGQYVKDGHGLIVTAGTFYYSVPNNNKLCRLLGIDETTAWTSTSTDLLHLLNTTHPIFTSVPNPLVFRQVGTALPSDGRWDPDDLTDGKYLALGQYQEGAIVAYRGLLYISPWLEIIPPYYHHHLQQLYNAIVWSRYQKPQHDLVASLESPAAVKPGKSAILNATVTNMGVKDETDVQLELLIGDSVVESVNIPELHSGNSYRLSHLWAPTVEGAYNITAYVLPVPNEDNLANNVKSLKVMVSALTVALFQNYDSWGYPANQEALDRLGITYVVLSSNDFGLTDLSMFSKVVIASDQDQSFYNGMAAYRTWFEDYVRSGGVLEIHAADFGWHGGRWEGSLPGGLEWESYYGQEVTVVDPAHPVLNTPNAITEAELSFWNFAVHGCFAAYPVDAHVIIIEDRYLKPAYLEFEYGAGAILATSQTIEWSYKNHFSLILENSLCYLPLRYPHDLLVKLEAPRVLELGNSAMLNITVLNRGLNSETNIELYLIINDTTVDHVAIPELFQGTFVTITHEWAPTENGSYNVTAYVPPVSGEDHTVNNVATRWVKVFHYTRLYLGHEWTGGGTAMDWHGDDAAWEFDLPFDFPFYGADYRKVYVSCNGLISFTGLDGSTDSNIPALAGKLAIAPAWDDWMTNQRPGDDIYISQPDSDHLIIRWQVVAFRDRSVEANFEVILGSEGIIQLNYGNNSGPVSATIGISNSEGHVLAEDLIDLNNINTIVFTPLLLQHDLAVELEAPTHVEPSVSILLNATVQNHGLNPETSVGLVLLIDDIAVDSVVIPDLLAGASFTLSYLWTPAIQGLHNVTAYTPPLPTEGYVTNNMVSKQVEAAVHDVAVINIIPASNIAYQGWIVTVNVTVGNLGGASETFSVTLFCDEVAVGTQPVVGLEPNATSQLSFSWNTADVQGYHNYTVKAIANAVLYEASVANNEFTDGQIEVRIMGDITGDGSVDIRDVTAAVLAFNAFRGGPRWKPDADLNGDGRVDVRDITFTVINFGKRS